MTIIEKIKNILIEKQISELRTRLTAPSLSTGSVAKILGVSEASIKRYSDSGSLKCCRTVGGHRKFTMDDVASYVEHNLSSNYPALHELVCADPEITPVEKDSLLESSVNFLDIAKEQVK